MSARNLCSLTGFDMNLVILSDKIVIIWKMEISCKFWMRGSAKVFEIVMMNMEENIKDRQQPEYWEQLRIINSFKQYHPSIYIILDF